MMSKLLLSSAMVLAVAMPTLAQADWYVIQGADRHCRIVDQRPTTKETTVVNPDGTTYTTRTEAETGMKTIKVCE